MNHLYINTLCCKLNKIQQYYYYYNYFLTHQFKVSLLCSFSGEVVLVAQRLDARYDWLPSPHNLVHKHTRFHITYYGNACHFNSEWEEESQEDDNKTHKKHKTKAKEGRIALVSPGGDCSLFTKVTGLLRWREVLWESSVHLDQQHNTLGPRSATH